MKQTLGPGDRIAPFTLLSYRENRSIAWEPGRVTLLSFCALWCDTWREQSARLRAVRRNLSGLPITYATISIDGRWAEKFADGSATDTGVLLDEGGRLSSRLGIRAVPWTLVLDQTGTVRLARQGIIRGEEVEALLRRLATRSVSANDAAEPIYLTFDDFPTVPEGSRISPDEELLDKLRAASVPATFFCIGEHLTTPTGASVARRAVREGHSLQIHTWDHNAARPDLGRCAHILRDVTGIAPALYRPPGHSDLFRVDGITPALPKRAVVNPYDYLRPGAAELTRRVLFATHPGAVIQLHAGVTETSDALPALIDSLRRRSLTFSLLR